MIEVQLTVGEAIEVHTLLQRAVISADVLCRVWPDVAAARPELQRALDRVDSSLLRTLQRDSGSVDEANSHLAALALRRRDTCASS